MSGREHSIQLVKACLGVQQHSRSSSKCRLQEDEKCLKGPPCDSRVILSECATPHVPSEKGSSILDDLESSSRRLEARVRKYPSSGRGIFKRMQERYVAVMPAKGKDEGEHEGLRLWKAGVLAYWENATEHRQGGTPKRSVHLMKIAKVCVWQDDDGGKSVLVRHKKGNDMQELVLCFPSKIDAEEWSYALWTFISMLRDVEAHALGGG